MTVEVLFALALSLFIVDVFFQTEIFVHISFILLTYIVVKIISVSLLYKIIIGMIIWWSLIFLYYWFWKNYILKIINKFLTPDKYQSGIDNKIGRKGEIEKVEGKLFIKIDDELYSYISKNDNDYEENDIVKIKSKNGSKLIID